MISETFDRGLMEPYDEYGPRGTDSFKPAKALALSQSITDGGNYSLMHVYSLKDRARKPGLETLSNIEKLGRHRGIKITSLGGIDWAEVFQNHDLHGRFRELDALAAKHLDDFWGGSMAYK